MNSLSVPECSVLRSRAIAFIAPYEQTERLSLGLQHDIQRLAIHSSGASLAAPEPPLVYNCSFEGICRTSS